MQNRFPCICHSGVGGRLIWNQLSGDQLISTQSIPPWLFSEAPSPQIAPLCSLLLHKLSTLGSPICTLPKTVLIQIVSFFPMCFACTPYSLVLIQRIPLYLGIKGDQFFGLKFFFGSRLTYKLVHNNLYLGYKFISKHVQLYLRNCSWQISTYQFVLFLLQIDIW